jgi:hypothetical protein
LVASATELRATVVPAVQGLFRTALAAPLDALLTSHREIRRRIEDRRAAHREYERAAKDFQLMQKRGEAAAKKHTHMPGLSSAHEGAVPPVASGEHGSHAILDAAAPSIEPDSAADPAASSAVATPASPARPSGGVGGGSGSGGSGMTVAQMLQAAAASASADSARSAALAQSKAVARLASAQEILSVLTATLSDELKAIRGREGVVCAHLLAGVSTSFSLGTRAFATAFCTGDLSACIERMQKLENDVDDVSVEGTLAPGTDSTLSIVDALNPVLQSMDQFSAIMVGDAFQPSGAPALSTAAPVLQSIPAASGTASLSSVLPPPIRWWDMGSAARAEARKEMVSRREKRRIRAEKHICRAIALPDRLASALQANKQCFHCNASAHVLCSPAFMSYLAQYLSLADVYAMAKSTKCLWTLMTQTPIDSQSIISACITHSGIRTNHLAKFVSDDLAPDSADQRNHADRLGAFEKAAPARLRFWLRALGLDGQQLAPWSFAYSAAVARHSETNAGGDHKGPFTPPCPAKASTNEEVLALARLAVAESAIKYLDDEDLQEKARWATMIEQDVLRTYVPGLSFGESPAVLRARSLLSQDSSHEETSNVGHENNRHRGREVGEASRDRSSVAAHRARAKSAPCFGSDEWENCLSSAVGAGIRREYHAGMDDELDLDNRLQIFTMESFLGHSEKSVHNSANGGMVGLPTTKRNRTRAASEGCVSTDDSPLIPLVHASKSAGRNQDDSHTVSHADVDDWTRGRRADLYALLMAVAAAEPSMRYSQGLCTIARFVLELVIAAGCAGSDPSSFDHDMGQISATHAGNIAAMPSGISRAWVSHGELPAAVTMAFNIVEAMLHIGDTSYKSPGEMKPFDVAGPGLGSMFSPDVTTVRLRMYQLERLLARVVPRTQCHLAVEGVLPTTYATSWFVTLFANFSAFDPLSVAHLWDSFLVDGWSPIFEASLHVVDMLRHRLHPHTPMEAALRALNAPRAFYEPARTHYHPFGIRKHLSRSATADKDTPADALALLQADFLGSLQDASSAAERSRFRAAGASDGRRFHLRSLRTGNGPARSISIEHLGIRRGLMRLSHNVVNGTRHLLKDSMRLTAPGADARTLTK